MAIPVAVEPSKPRPGWPPGGSSPPSSGPLQALCLPWEHFPSHLGTSSAWLSFTHASRLGLHIASAEKPLCPAPHELGPLLLYSAPYSLPVYTRVSSLLYISDVIRSVPVFALDTTFFESKICICLRHCRIFNLGQHAWYIVSAP